MPTSIPLRSFAITKGRSLWISALLAIAMAPPAPAQDPAPKTSASVPAPSAYVLANSDAIRVEIFQEPDLTTSARIDAEGTIRLPLVGNVRIAGLTVPEAQKTIARAFRDGEFLHKAHVTVRVEAYTPREVMISGQVRSPGNYALPVENEMNVLDLISRAGGLTDLARGNAVSLIRTSPSGEKQTIAIDAASLLQGKGNAKAPTLALQPGDLVFVPERIF